MHAVAALCHFCENHGPRVVMTTQCVRDPGHCTDDTSQLPGPPLLPDSTGSYGVLRGEFFVDGYRPAVEEEARCMACSSFAHPYGVCTTDSSAHISYISSQISLNDRVNQLVKHACLRSLSCEISGSTCVQPPRSPVKSLPRLPKSGAVDTRCRSLEDSWLEVHTDSSNDGVVFFGDDLSGYTLSHTFRVRDAKARGFQRWFSLIILSMDKYLITSNYDFFVSGLASIIQQLQEQANAVFRVERTELTNECLKQANASRSSMLPAHFLRTRVAKLDLDTSRSLSLITGCPAIFTKLHKQMTWLLRTQSRLCVESVLEGVPSQDSLVQLEQPERERPEAQPHPAYCYVDDCAHSVRSIATLQCFATKLCELPPFKGAVPLDALLSQLVLGAQIVVKCDEQAFTKQLLVSLSYLLPVGCIRMVYADSFEEAYKYNLFGCPRATEVPSAIDVVIISVEYSDCGSPPESTCASVSPQSVCRFGSPSLEDGDQREDLTTVCDSSRAMIASKVRSEFDGCAVAVERLPRSKRSCMPTVASRYRQLLLDSELGWRVLHAVIRNTREQWLSKAKLIYQLSRQKETIDLSKVLHIVKCCTEDVAVLNFWQAGLSKAYKDHVLTAVGGEEKLCV